MDEQEVYKGGTLIISLETIEVEGEEYIFVTGDKVRFAIKPKLKNSENVLYKEVEPTEGDTSIETVFTDKETNESFVVGANYVLQADLINSKGTFPMHLENLHVIGQAIMVGDN